MTKLAIFGNALVVERDSFYLDRIMADLRDHPIIITKTLKEAMVMLKKPQNRISCLFVSSNFGVQDTLSFIKQVRKIKAEIPVVVIYHHDYLKIPGQQTKELINLSAIDKPDDGRDIIKEIQRLFPETQGWKGIAPSGEATHQELTLKDDDFIGISFDEYLMTKKSFFNVYIRLAADKFVKILNAGDGIEEDIKNKYQKKNVDKFWLKRDEFRHYTDMSEKTAAKLTTGNITQATSSLGHLGDNVVKELSRFGIDDEGLYHADRFLGHSISAIKRVRGIKAEMMTMVEELSKTEHTTATVVIASLLANSLNIESAKAIKVVGVAALMHDIALWQPGQQIPSEIESELSGAELEKFKLHAVEGAKKLEATGLFEEVVIQAIAQHHDRRKDAAGTKLNLISELIGVSDAFCHQVMYSSNKRAMQDFLTLELPKFSQQIEKCFRQVFVEPKKK
ncbi:MAG: HD domain-containing protein [Bacteriovoracia bacterium]